MNRQYSAMSGAAIVLIVLNHAIHFGLQASPASGPWPYILTVLQALGGFAVPAFLFISGAFLSYSAGRLSPEFIKTNLGRLLWPYLIWSLLFYGLVFVVGAERYSVAGYAKNLIVGYPYHFVPLLVFWYLSAPLLVKIGRRHAWPLLVGIAAYQAVLLVGRYPDLFGVPGLAPWAKLVRVPVLATPMSDWAVFFPLGLVVSMHDRELKPRLMGRRLLMALLTGSLLCLGLLDAFRMVSAPWARFVAPLPLMFVLPVISRDAIPYWRGLEALGKRSYGIYLSHFIVINLAAYAVSALGLAAGIGAVLVYPALLIVAIGVPVLMMDVLTRPVSVRRVYRHLFGIAPPPPPAPVQRSGAKAPMPA
jgi:fucose 4-O-acetylase-like acetyltransferase